MTLKDAKEGAEQCASDTGLIMIVAREGPHADDYAELDPDGESYGYCPQAAKATLYPHGQVVAIIDPNKTP